MQRLPLVLALSLSAGCVSTSYTPASQAQPLDDSALRALLASRSYRQQGFSRVDAAPYHSAIPADAAQWIDIYVSDAAAADYRQISPQTQQTGLSFPVGGVVIREVQDASGALERLTVMERREAGYFPACGDFLFGVTDPDGAPVDDDQGAPEWGNLATCATCHATRQGQGYLFGVPLDNRGAP